MKQSGRAVRPCATRFSYPVIPFTVRAFLFLRDQQFPNCCGSLVSESLASFLSDPLAGLVSGVLPSSVASPLPNLVPDSHPEFLPWFPCGSRFRSSWEILSRRSCELRDSRSCCSSSPLTRSRFGFTRAAPVNFPAKLLFLVPLTISARFYPGRIFESPAKPYAPAFVRVNPV